MWITKKKLFEYIDLAVKKELNEQKRDAEKSALSYLRHDLVTHVEHAHRLKSDQYGNVSPEHIYTSISIQRILYILLDYLNLKINKTPETIKFEKKKGKKNNDIKSSK